MEGKIEKENKEGQTYFTYDKDKMKKILDNNFYNELFGENGIRHKLAHGEMVDVVFGKDYVDEIYKKIICYFNTELKTNISQKVINPQRHFYGNYGFKDLWLKPKDKFKIDLKNCFERLNKKDDTVKGMNKCERVFNININGY